MESENEVDEVDEVDADAYDINPSNFLFSNMDETRRYLNQRYFTDIEQLQPCVDFISREFSNHNPQSLVAAVAKLLRVDVQPDGQISHPDVDPMDLVNEEGNFDQSNLVYGPRAATLGKPLYHKELFRLQSSLEEHDHMPQIGGDATFKGITWRRGVSDMAVDDSEKLHRLLLLSDAAVHFLMSYSVLATAISDTVFRQAGQKFDPHIFMYEGKLTSEMVVQNLQYNAAAKLEMYIARMMWVCGFKLESDMVYKQVFRTKTRRIACFNDDKNYYEYMCALCGESEDAHAYTRRTVDRKTHVFKFIEVPVEGVPQMSTLTFKPYKNLKTFIYEFAGRVENQYMWTHTRASGHIVDMVCKHLKNAPPNEVPRLNKIAAWSYEDGVAMIESGEFYPYECNCYDIDSINSVTLYCPLNDGLGEKNHITGKFENVPASMPDDGRPQTCNRCRAGCQPMANVWGTMFHEGTYMDYPRVARQMAGGLTVRYTNIMSEWVHMLLQETTKTLTDHGVGDDGLKEIFAKRMYNSEEVDDILESTEKSAMEFILDENVPWEDMLDYLEDIIKEHLLEEDVYGNIEFAAEEFSCDTCKKFFQHPDHAPLCHFIPHPENFKKCQQCEESPDHASHVPKCRVQCYAPIYENLVKNKRKVCLKCKQNYDGCECPRGFSPFSEKVGCEHHIDTRWWDSILNTQDVPQVAINFLYAMIGRTLLGQIGKFDNIQGMVFIWGPPRNGKSTWQDGLEGMYPSIDVGFMPDNAQEQFGWEQTVDRNTDKMKSIILCKEVSLKFKIPMTELQLASDGKEFTIIRKGLTPLNVSFDAMMWFVGNEIPFTGAMLRRLIAVNLPYQVKEGEEDGGLINRMKRRYPQVQLRAARAFLSLRIKHGQSMALNSIWPSYFAENCKLISSKKEPMYAFLHNITQATMGNGRIPWEIPKDDDVNKKKNYVSLHQFMIHFKRYCRNAFPRNNALANPTNNYKEYTPSFNKYGLKVILKNKRWEDLGGDGCTGAKLVKQLYVVGIRDPSQQTQPGCNMNDAGDEEEIDMAIHVRRAINISGKPIEELVRGTLPDVRLEGTLYVEDIQFLADKFLKSKENREDGSTRNAVFNFIVDMTEYYSLESRVRNMYRKRKGGNLDPDMQQRQKGTTKY